MPKDRKWKLKDRRKYSKRKCRKFSKKEKERWVIEGYNARCTAICSSINSEKNVQLISKLNPPPPQKKIYFNRML